MVRPHDHAAAQELSRVLRAHRREAAEVFATALRHTRRWPQTLDEAQRGWDAFLRDHFFVLIDYLAQYFAGNDGTFKQLFAGEKIKALYDPALDDVARRSQAQAVIAAERQGLEALLRPRLSAPAWSLLEGQLRAVEQLLAGEAPTVQRVLFIGDCLFLDIVPFIVGDLMEAGVAIVPDYATAKNPAELRDHLRRLSQQKKFDIVFYSPFSYEFAVEYARLNHWRNALLGEDEQRRVADQAWAEAKQTLDLAADLFDCPIHVHNSSAVIREESAIKRTLKLTVTSPVRHAARDRVNEALRRHVERKNAESFRHLFVLDELAVVKQHGEGQSGAFHYRTAMQHPAQLGRFLAERYVDILFVNAHLLTKKLVVSDLDNTLWDGVIGEGPVAHHHDRQRALKALKDKGVVLAVLSKNDPSRVHWTGGSLAEEDFVCSAISWDPKVQGMRRIQAELNLKMKDFVFLDDREDELALMRASCADVLCLDATQPATWTRLALWQEMLDADLDMDRTLMYRQREARKSFVAADLASDSEKAAMFAGLELTLSISRARQGDLKRVAELINRTNQFNLEGSRTTVKEVAQWHASPEHVVLVGQTSDRFGDMGTTCVAVAHMANERMQLLPFVLSCRVFGYGIERSMMNHLKTLAAQAGMRQIVGRYVETPQNAPCRDFLAENGFRQDGAHWIFDVGGSALSDVQWLRVEVATA